MKNLELSIIDIQGMDTHEMRKLDGGILTLGNKIQDNPGGAKTVIGGVAGGAVGSPFGPFGLLFGAVAGLFIGHNI